MTGGKYGAQEEGPALHVVLHRLQFHYGLVMLSYVFDVSDWAAFDP